MATFAGQPTVSYNYNSPPNGTFAYNNTTEPAGIYNRNFDSVSSQTTFGQSGTLASNKTDQTVIIVDSRTGRAIRVEQGNGATVSGNASVPSGDITLGTDAGSEEGGVLRRDLFAPLRDFVSSMLFGPVPSGESRASAPVDASKPASQKTPSDTLGLTIQPAEDTLSPGNPEQVLAEIPEGPVPPPIDPFHSRVATVQTGGGSFSPLGSGGVLAFLGLGAPANAPAAPGPGEEVAIQIGASASGDIGATMPAEKQEKKGVLESIGAAVKTVTTTIAQAIKLAFARLFGWL